MTPPPVAVVGCTASGKSALAMEVARARPEVEIVSVDSMLVYRGMDIGTAKPTTDERAEVPHHLIDLVAPTEEFSVSEFQRIANRVLADIDARGRRALLVGGTGLYVRALVDGLDIPGQYPAIRAELEAAAEPAGGLGQLHAELNLRDPVAAARMEPTNRRRIVRALEVCRGSGRRFSSFGPGLDAYRPSPVRQLGVTLPRPVIDERIASRYEQQLRDGFVDEVSGLLGRMGRTARQALGYKELADHLEGRSTLDEALDLAGARTRRFARRQDRWFQRDPRICWFRADRNPLELLGAVLGEFDRCG